MASHVAPVVSSYFKGEQLGYLPDNALLKISTRLHTSDYIRLGAYLKVNMQDMGYLSCERTVASQAREMFMTWYRKRSDKRWSELATALAETYRMDHIKFTRDFMDKHDMWEGLENADDEWKMERYFSLISEECPRDWKDIGIYLGVTANELAFISQPVPSDRTIKNPVYEVLRAWKYNETSPPMALIKVLEEDMHRRDVAIYVESLYAATPTRIKEVCVDGVRTI